MIRHAELASRLADAHGRADEGLKSLDLAQALIASRGQPVNADASGLEALRSAILLDAHRYAEAEQHARAALQLARISAVDPGSSARMGEALVLEARAEAALGKPAAAVTAREALTHLLANLDPAHPLIAQARGLAAGPASR